MRALFRGQVNPIGAKWLRTEAGNAGFRSETEEQGENSGNDGSKHDPVITPTNLETVGRGENAGVGNIQNLNVKAGKELNIPLISGHPNKKDITVIESKKRRTDNGPDPGHNMGLNQDVLMDSSEENIIEEYAEISENKDGSKNAYVASAHGGCSPIIMSILS